MTASRNIRRRHGRARTTEYVIYNTMKQRCYLKTCRAYPLYGGRGITMCDRWLGPDGFLHFIADVGERPPGTTLDRRDNDEGYSPENCEWVTYVRQTRNRRLTLRVNGEPLADLAERAGLDYRTVYSRFRRGKTGAELTAPLEAAQ